MLHSVFKHKYERCCFQECYALNSCISIEIRLWKFRGFVWWNYYKIKANFVKASVVITIHYIVTIFNIFVVLDNLLKFELKKQNFNNSITILSTKNVNYINLTNSFSCLIYISYSLLLFLWLPVLPTKHN